MGFRSNGIVNSTVFEGELRSMFIDVPKLHLLYVVYFRPLRNRFLI